MKFSEKNIENWRSPENDFCLVFWFLVFGYWVDQNFFFFFFSQWKDQRLSYEVAFISALWMVSSESWKRLYPNWYAHDCNCQKLIIWSYHLIELCHQREITLPKKKRSQWLEISFFSCCTWKKHTRMCTVFKPMTSHCKYIGWLCLIYHTLQCRRG